MSFLLGTLFGGTLGFIIMALITVGSSHDDE